jgi:hypothetical protein
MKIKKLENKGQEVKTGNFPKLSSKRAQEVKTGNFPKLTSKRGQEEIMGFGIILILIAVILIVFLTFSKGNQEGLENDFESTSFLSSILEVSTSCEDNGKYISIKDLAFECSIGIGCDNGLDSCEVFNETLEEIMKESWDVNENSTIRGYSLVIENNDERMLNLSDGENFGKFRGSSREYSKSGENVAFYIKIYS